MLLKCDCTTMHSFLSSAKLQNNAIDIPRECKSSCNFVDMIGIADWEFGIPKTNPNYELAWVTFCVEWEAQKWKYEHVQKISGACIWEFRAAENLMRGVSNIKPRGPITFNICPLS